MTAAEDQALTVRLHPDLLDIAGDVLTALGSDLGTRSAELDAVMAVLLRHLPALVPKDDEDTVRVPTEAPDEALNALARLSHEVIASTHRTGASTEAALRDVQAIEDVLRALNGSAS